jgi:hypothetical protein
MRLFLLEWIPMMLNCLSESWPGSSWLVPAIHAFLAQSPKEDVDARDQRGHDDGTEVMERGDSIAPKDALNRCCALTRRLPSGLDRISIRSH